MRRLLFVLPLLIFVVVAGYFAVPLITGKDPSVLPSALIDRPVPTFDLAPLPGQESGFTSADLTGDVRLVNVFASWCAPCRVEHPLLMRLAEDEGIPIHGINYKDEPAAALAYLAEAGDPYATIGADREGRVAIDWGVYGVPETFVVDQDGRIRYKITGPVMPHMIDQEILPLVDELRRRAGG